MREEHDRRGSHLVQGPAGTGKTTWLARRLTALIEAGETGIVFLVSNRRAARALNERILRDLGRSTGDVRVSTWHAFALSILRLYYPLLGYEREPGLLTGPEQYAFVSELVRGDTAHWEGFEAQLRLGGFAQELREFVMRAQDAMESPESLSERARLARRPELAKAAGFFDRYLQVMDAQSRVDASNAIALAVNLLAGNDEVAAEVRAGTRHLLVDDYQDATVAQEALLRALFDPQGSVAVAADHGARVYGFRGGLPDAIERYKTLFPPVIEHTLAEPHRGPASRDAWLFDHLTEEADAIAREARRRHAREGTPWGEIAVIVRRYGPGTRAIRRAFDRHDVPYVVVGENRPLIAEPALRPMLELTRAALRHAEADELLPGLLSSPVGGLDPYDVRALRREARLRGLTLTDLVRLAPSELNERLRGALSAVHELLEEVRDLDASGCRPDELFFHLWDRLPMFRDMVARADEEELDAVAAFSRAVERFSERRPGASFEDFLDAISGPFGPEPWTTPTERRPNAVRIMTAHHAVGAESDVVFVAGAVEGEFPDSRAPRPMLDVRDLLAPASPFERRMERLAEEKRLFGVATSRARVATIVTAARESSQREALNPSPFVPATSWGSPPTALDALTRAEAETAARRVLRAHDADPAAVADAMEVLTRLPGVDPDDWWYEREWTDPGTAINTEELRTSYSRLSVYENCPLQYLYQVELGLDPSTSHAMLVGTWIHDIVDRAARGEIALTEDALYAELDKVWDPTIFEGLAIEHRRKRDCREMLSVWLNCDANLDTLASESAFAFPVDGALVRGRIDRLVRFGTTMVRVIDYKTGRWAKSEAELREDLQLAIYNLAMHRDPELSRYGKPKHLELAFLGTAWRGGFKRPGMDPTKIENYEARTEATIAGFVGKIKAEEFAPNPDADCRWCSFKTLCPIWAEGDEVNL